MRKVIAAMNMTLDGYCDHTYGIADAELHDHYTELLNTAEVLLYGRITYQLMEDAWPAILKNPTGQKDLDDFASTIDRLPKIVFSKSDLKINWSSAHLTKRSPEEEVTALRQEPGKDILVGSPSLINTLTKLRLIDEYQLCVHPVVAGKGLKLFRDQTESTKLNLFKMKTLGSGAVVFYYTPELKAS